MLLHDGAQLRQPPEQPPGRRLLSTQHFQHSQLGAVHTVFVQIPAVAQLVGQKPHGIVRRHTGQAGQPCGHLAHRGAGARADAVLVDQRGPAALPVLPCLPGGVQRLRPCHRHAELEITAQKGVGIVRAGCQRKNIRDIPHDLVGEKGLLDRLAAIRHAAPLTQVDDGQRALMVAEEHSGLDLAMLRLRKQKGQLVSAAAHLHDPDRLPGPLRRGNGFRAAVAVARHKAVGSGQDRLPRAVVFLHQQHPRAGVGLFKVHQCLRVGRAEAVNALVLIPDHKKVAALLRQHPDDLMLHAGGILRLIHAEIAVPLTERRRHGGGAVQDLQRKAELVIVVHFVPRPEGLLVSAVQRRQILKVRLQLVKLGIGQAHIFNVGDGCAQLLEGAFGGVFMVDALPQLQQQRRSITLALQQVGRGAAVHPAVERDNTRRHAVDGAELHPRRLGIPEPRGKPGAHLLRGGHRVGHCQDRLRRDAADLGHVAQSGDQHGGLAAARHRQQQHRAVYGCNGGFLLGVQRRHVGGLKRGFLHGGLLSAALGVGGADSPRPGG